MRKKVTVLDMTYTLHLAEKKRMKYGEGGYTIG